ncbi:Vegetative incompatibility protein HET-E-1 [Colletotrichum tropicale]|nr:Vegetative incompatibility protein HET-E-1 [Colletotrichum tropicale]
MRYDYTWIDTCCIDKTSSAELSEAINPMFTWYRDSGICLAHLEDFHGDHISQATAENRWFTRGWTLQELIAPEKVYFYSASWSEIGRKPNNILDLLRITQIDAAVLDMGELDNISVAEKMRWLARRNTTKPEDMAYCMLGIFNVNIPLIYGEGEKAFKRLQEEIMRSSDDVSILLWKAQESNSFTYRGALARNAIEFAQSTASRASDHSKIVQIERRPGITQQLNTGSQAYRK